MKELKTAGWLTMRLDDMNNYLKSALSYQDVMEGKQFPKGTFKKEEVQALIGELNENIEKLKKIGFVIVETEEENENG